MNAPTRPTKQVADEPEAPALRDLACQPTGNNSDDEDYEETLTGEVHVIAF